MNSHPDGIAHGNAFHKRASRDLKAKKESAVLKRNAKRDKIRIQVWAKHKALTNGANCQVCPSNPNLDLAVVPIHPSSLVKGKREREGSEDLLDKGCL